GEVVARSAEGLGPLEGAEAVVARDEPVGNVAEAREGLGCRALAAEDRRAAEVAGHADQVAGRDRDAICEVVAGIAPRADPEEPAVGVEAGDEGVEGGAVAAERSLVDLARAEHRVAREP